MGAGEEKEWETLTRSQVSPMVRGPCSRTMSKMVRVMVCVCSGGVFSSMGFIFGFGFFAAHLAIVANTIVLLLGQLIWCLPRISPQGEAVRVSYPATPSYAPPSSTVRRPSTSASVVAVDRCHRLSPSSDPPLPPSVTAATAHCHSPPPPLSAAAAARHHRPLPSPLSVPLPPDQSFPDEFPFPSYRLGLNLRWFVNPDPSRTKAHCPPGPNQFGHLVRARLPCRFRTISDHLVRAIPPPPRPTQSPKSTRSALSTVNVRLTVHYWGSASTWTAPWSVARPGDKFIYKSSFFPDSSIFLI